MEAIVILLCCAKVAKGGNVFFENMAFLVATKISHIVEFGDLCALGNCDIEGESLKKFDHFRRRSLLVRYLFIFGIVFVACAMSTLLYFFAIYLWRCYRATRRVT